MKYSYSKNLKMNLVTAENKVREVLMEVGFGVLTEINIKEAFKNKLNIDFKNYKILGACNPELANSAIEIEELIGILMPCNILIIDNLDETTKIVAFFTTFRNRSNVCALVPKTNLLKLEGLLIFAQLSVTSTL